MKLTSWRLHSFRLIFPLKHPARKETTLWNTNMLVMTWSILHLPSISNPSKHTCVTKKVLELRWKLNEKMIYSFVSRLDKFKNTYWYFQSLSKIIWEIPPISIFVKTPRRGLPTFPFLTKLSRTEATDVAVGRCVSTWVSLRDTDDLPNGAAQHIFIEKSIYLLANVSSCDHLYNCSLHTVAQISPTPLFHRTPSTRKKVRPDYLSLSLSLFTSLFLSHFHIHSHTHTHISFWKRFFGGKNSLIKYFLLPTSEVRNLATDIKLMVRSFFKYLNMKD
jgi:hypothetical protein